jgi:hypothetical protein
VKAELLKEGDNALDERLNNLRYWIYSRLFDLTCIAHKTWDEAHALFAPY